MSVIRRACATVLFLLLAHPASAQSTVASYVLSEGWATFGLVLPQGAAASGVQVGTLATQTDVKTRWADGSIRFAVVTARVPVSGMYPIRAASASTGTFDAAVPAADVRLTIEGTTYSARPEPANPDSWLDGPLVREWRSVVTPANDSGAHPFLRVIFDTRVYNTGETRLDVTVENLLDVAGATSVTYDVDVIANGQSVFSRPNVSHPWLTRWRKVFGLGGFVPASVTPDFEPTAQAGALPRYLPTVNDTIETPAGAAFDILGVGALDPSMPDTGGRAELAPYPDWAARYVVHRQATQREFVLAHGDLAGSWPIHIRESDGRLVSIDERPNFWLDGRCEPDGISCPRGNLGALGSLVPDKSHQPSLAYVPYLLTGDRYYADELAFWANYEFLSTWPTERQGSTGLIYYYEIRGFAWSLRTLGDAAAYLPDTYPSKAFFVSKVATNLQWADDWADGKITFGRVAQPLHPLGISFYYDDGGGSFRVGEWENYYLAWSIDHLQQQGFSGGIRLRDRIVRLALAGYTDPTFPRGCVFYYRPIVGYTPSQFFTTMAEFAQQGACLDTRDLADAYWGLWQRPTLLIALREGWAGSAEAYAYMMSYASAAGTVLQRAQEFAGWALADDGNVALPPPPAPSGETVTFDDLAGANEPLIGEYPVGVIDWDATSWYLSAPWGGFATRNISFDGIRQPGITHATFTLLVPRIVASLDAYNGGSDAATVTIACAGQPERSFNVALHMVTRLDTGWSGPCVGPVVLGSSNGWNTNFDNLRIPIPQPADTEPPQISNVAATHLTPTTATIEWVTDEPADSTVVYGTTAAYGATIGSLPALITAHSAELPGLVPDTTYHYSVISRDAAGNGTQSGDYTFRTPPLPAPLAWLTPARLNFGAVERNGNAVITPAQVMKLMIDGGGATAWHASTNQAWVSISPADGRGNSDLTIEVRPDAARLAPGDYDATVMITGGSTPTPQTASIHLTVYARGTTAPPSGTIDSPQALSDGEMLRLSGWALDDIGIARVRVYRDPIAGERRDRLIVMGDAIRVRGARPDIAASAPAMPANHDSAWAFLIPATDLPGRNKTYTFNAYAEDLDGHSTWLGSRTLRDTIAPPPLPGAPDGKDGIRLPPGLMKDVYLDGVPVDRSTRPSPGIHTIAWPTRHADLPPATVGSWYAVVVNAEITAPWNGTLIDAMRPVIDGASSLSGITLSPEVRVARVVAGQLLRLDLASMWIAGPATYVGYQTSADGLTPLPVGSTLDATGGAFTWVPGPGFGGTHDLVFLRRDSTSSEAIRVRVVITP